MADSPFFHNLLIWHLQEILEYQLYLAKQNIFQTSVLPLPSLQAFSYHFVPHLAIKVVQLQGTNAGVALRTRPVSLTVIYCAHTE